MASFLGGVNAELALHTTKNDRPATGIMPVAVAEKMKAFIGDRTEGPVFMARGRRISTRHCQRRLSGWLTKAKIIGKSAHAFRHTFATRIYGATGDLQLTQAALGHASIVSTCIYARIDRAKLRAAVGA